MIEAVHELWKTAEASCFSGVLVQDIQILGEIDGRLFSLHEEEEYAQRGGARYVGNVPITNKRVLTMGLDEQRNAVHDEVGRGQYSAEAEEEGMSRNAGKCRHGSVRECLSRISLLSRWGILQTADATLRVAASILPFLRLFYPSAVPKSVARSSLLVSSSSANSYCGRVGYCPSRKCGPERVTAMAFHPYRPLLAIVVDEGGSCSQARVHVVDVVKSTFEAPLSLSCVLTHAFQKRVEAVAWKPFSDDVLAVGCESGVLLWSLEPEEGISSFGKPNGATAEHLPGLEKYDAERPITERYPTFRSSSSVSLSSGVASQSSSSPLCSSSHACCVFYPFCSPGIPVTSLAFSSETGRFLACGSRFYCVLSLVDVTVAPYEEHRNIKWTPSLDGGTEGLQFAPTGDEFLLSLTCGHASVTVTPLRLPGSTSDGGDMVSVVSTSKRIATPFHVLVARPATGLMSGGDAYYYFLQLGGMEGLVLARLELAKSSLHIVSLISTRVERGLGGLVRTFACSKRRLWVATETGHLLVMYYHRQHYWTERGGYIGAGHTDPGRVMLIPIGAASMDVSHLESFDGFTPGSLAAIVEQGHILHLLPSYHA